jgi:oxygen-dependent protoporphyrinogen oxidase
VLEASARAGSKLSSYERDGFLVDRGAFFIPTTHRYLIDLARDAGIDGELVPGGFGFGAVRAGEIHQLDGNHLLRAFSRTRLLSTRAKFAAAKLAPEALRARRATVDRIAEARRYDTESLTSWAERSLNGELAEFLIDPIIRSIYAAEGEDVSRVELLGIIALFGGAKLVAFRGGMAQYADRLASRLTVEADSEVLSVEQTADGADVVWRDAAGVERSESVGGCVVALPAQLAVGVLPRLDPWRAEYMSRVRRGKLVVVNIGLSRRPPGVDATYTMIPRSEHPFLGGIVCDHNKAPGRAPPGKGLLTLAPTNPWCEAHSGDDDDALAAAGLEAVERFMPGTTDAVEFVDVSRWRQQYNPVGHYAGLAEFRARSAAADSTVQLAGEYLSAPQLSAATAAGEHAARAVAAALATR